MNKSGFDDEFDRWFEEAARDSEQFQSGPVPDPAASWALLQKRLKKEQRKAVWVRRTKWATLSAASLLVGAFLFSTLQTTEAFRPMFEMVYKMKDSGISVRSTESTSTEGAKTPPPPPDDQLPPQKLEDRRDLPEEGSFRRVKVTLDEAVSNTQFAMKRPAYLPPGYALQEATLHFSMGESKASALKLVYRGNDSNGGQGTLEILVRKRSFSASADRPDGQRTFILGQNSENELEWNFQDVNTIVKADLSEQELNRVADGLSADVNQ